MLKIQGFIKPAASFAIATILAFPATASNSSLNQCIAKLAKEQNYSGIVLFAEGEQIKSHQAFNFAGIDSSKVMPGMRFNIGSATKSMTAILVGQLIEQGRVNADDSIRKHLPSLPERYQVVTIHHLLTHTSGIGNMFQPKNRKALYAYRELDDLIPLVLAESQSFPPGEQYQYSNSGFVLLGKMIEAISGMRYEDYLQKHIFDVAGMQASGLMWDENTATGYTKGMRRLMGQPEDPSAKWSPTPRRKGMPAGGSYHSAEDILKYVSAFRNNQLTSPETRDLITSPKPGTRGTSRRGFDFEYGYGFFIMEDGAMFGHGGGGMGVNFEMRIWPELDHIVITQANIDPSAATKMAIAVEDLVQNKHNRCD